MTYFLGVDGGASKTAALVTDSEGKSLGDGIAGPSNHLRVGIETASRNIERAVNKALVAADVASREITWAYCGIAGADHPAHRQEVVDSLNIFFPRGNFTVDNDARIALTGAIGFGAGVVVIAGTGSVAFGRNEKGEEARAGGWGPIVGDEGSAYGIARAGLAAVLREFDGRGQKTLITQLLERDYEMSAEELPRFVYASTHGVYDFADTSSVQSRLLIKFLERAVFKKRFRDHREDFEAASPIRRVSSDDPPFFVIHGHHDSLVPVKTAIRFVQKLREVAQDPVVYAELPGAQHAFDVFPSIRTAHVTRAVERFADYVYSVGESRKGSAGTDREPAAAEA